MSRYLLVIGMVLCHDLLYCQDAGLSELITGIAEELAEDDSEEEEIAAYIDRLNELAENPVKINSGNPEEISRIFFLTDFQVKLLADYISTTGRLLSVFELAGIPGFDRETAEMMIPFITMGYKSEDDNEPGHLENNLITNVSMKSFIKDSAFPGSPLKFLAKYRFNANGYSGGLTLEKDPGEKFFTGEPPLPDFLSAFISYNGQGIIKKIIIGDYSARFAQGININTGPRMGLSVISPGFMTARDEIRPYTSSDENRFFRGIAAELSIGNTGLQLFISGNNYDATLGSVTGGSKDIIENFYPAGLHNTRSLLSKRDAIRVNAGGINLFYRLKNARIGLTCSDTRFSLPVNPTGNLPEDAYSFRGRESTNFSAYYKGFIKNLLLYGEFSSVSFKNHAFVQGISLRPSDRLTINLMLRHYDPGFFSMYGKGPGMGSASCNEKGILGNFVFEAASHLFISAGCDVSHYPWLKYRCSFPSSGVKEEIKMQYNPGEKINIDMAYSYRFSMRDSSNVSGIPGINETEAHTMKGMFRYHLNDRTAFTTRIFYKIVSPEKSRGMLLLQDVSCRPWQFPLTIWARFCCFNTYDWDSRLYVYENDLLYSFMVPAFSGRGSRICIMTCYDLSSSSEIRVKYGITTLAGNDNSMKNSGELKLQFRLHF
jgi:hypothetical protein